MMRGVVLLAATILAGLFGLFMAAGAQGSSRYTIGLALAVACTLFGFQVIRTIIDGPAHQRLLPDKPRSGWTAIAILAIVGLIGLFVASGGDSAQYWTGLALSGASLLLIMRTMKAVFDRLDREAQAPGARTP